MCYVVSLGETAHHASAWVNAPKEFHLETPYPELTADSRFADAAADKAALAAVAFTAGLGTAEPVAGLSTNRKNTMGDLPAMRQGMLRGDA